MDIDEVVARMEIMDVLWRYCRGVDRGDAQLLNSVYHEGAIDDHGTYNGPAAGFVDYIVPGMDIPDIVGQHHITNVNFEFDGDVAKVESYFIAYHPVPIDGGPDELAIVGGRYNDTFEKRNGKWLIAHRRVLGDFSRDRIPGPAWPRAVNFPQGDRHEKDPSTGFFTNM
jgi:hypothetical protein